MSVVSVLACIKKYGDVHDQELVEHARYYPYPEANGMELVTALENAALSCNRAAVAVLLHQFQFGYFGQCLGDYPMRISYIGEIEKKVQQKNLPKQSMDTILAALKNTKKMMQEREDADQRAVSEMFVSTPKWPSFRALSNF